MIVMWLSLVYGVECGCNFLFFQAEDGIRDGHVTGVQTCALPISNYLDIEALEALEILLKDYDGTVIFVSHDRTFVENIADRIIEIKDHSLNIFDGDYKAYIEHQSQKEHEIGRAHV